VDEDCEWFAGLTSRRSGGREDVLNATVKRSGTAFQTGQASSKVVVRGQTRCFNPARVYGADGLVNDYKHAIVARSLDHRLDETDPRTVEAILHLRVEAGSANNILGRLRNNPHTTLEPGSVTHGRSKRGGVSHLEISSSRKEGDSGVGFVPGWERSCPGIDRSASRRLRLDSREATDTVDDSKLEWRPDLWLR